MNDLNTDVQIFLKSKIFLIDNIAYILDKDLAEFYGMETKKFNEAVKRNLYRFGNGFIIQLTKEQKDAFLPKKDQKGGTNYLPYAFTFEGTVLLCGFLNSPIAVEKAKYIATEFARLKLLEQQNKLNQVNQVNTNYEIETIKNNFMHEATEKFVSKDEFNFFVEKMIEIIDTKKTDTPQRNTIGFIL